VAEKKEELGAKSEKSGGAFSRRSAKGRGKLGADPPDKGNTSQGSIKSR